MKEIKDKTIEIRLTASDKQKIKDAAEKHGMTVSEFIRFACEKIFNQKES